MLNAINEAFSDEIGVEWFQAVAESDEEGTANHAKYRALQAARKQECPSHSDH